MEIWGSISTSKEEVRPVLKTPRRRVIDTTIGDMKGKSVRQYTVIDKSTGKVRVISSPIGRRWRYSLPKKLRRPTPHSKFRTSRPSPRERRRYPRPNTPRPPQPTVFVEKRPARTPKPLLVPISRKEMERWFVNPEELKELRPLPLKPPVVSTRPILQHQPVGRAFFPRRYVLGPQTIAPFPVYYTWFFQQEVPYLSRNVISRRIPLPVIKQPL